MMVDAFGFGSAASRPQQIPRNLLLPGPDTVSIRAATRAAEALRGSGIAVSNDVIPFVGIAPFVDGDWFRGFREMLPEVPSPSYQTGSGWRSSGMEFHYWRDDQNAGIGTTTVVLTETGFHRD